MDNSQSVPPGYKETDVGVIPKDWETERIGVLTNIVGGGTPSTDVARYWDGQIPWVSAGDVSRSNGRYVQNTAESISDLGLKSCSASIMPKGTTVIIARGATVGRMAQLASAMAFNQTCYGLLPIDGVDRNYLYYAMLYSVKSMKALTYGTIFGTITTNSFDQWQIPLPSPSEQRAIAEVLSDVDALIAALERLIAKKRAIKQGAMQQLLTGKIRLPGFTDEWETKRLGEIADISKGQLITKKDTVNGDIPVIAGGKQPAYYHNKPNRFGKTITISASGAHAGYVSFHTKPIYASDCSTIDEDEGYNTEFVFYQLQMNQERIYAMQTGGAQPHVHAKDLSPLNLRFVEVKEQRAIATVLSDMDAEIAALEARRDKTRALKQGMMQQLLTGRIRLV